MDRFLSRRFTTGLFSGLSVLMLFVVGHSVNGMIGSVLASDRDIVPTKPSQDNSKDVPGLFKNLPDKTDAITSKRVVEAPPLASINQPPETPLAIDPNKGISVKLSAEADVSGMKDFHATAYCLKGRTASGAYVRPGVIAADPRVLPLGTVVHVRAGRYTGTYTVLDTGGRIKGNLVDIYVPTYKEAKRFGRQRIKIKVLGRATRRADPARKNSVLAEL